MKACDAGLLTYLPAANHFEAMPNKAFEYMACSLPMVLSEFPYWKELFGDSAVYVNPESPESIASGINKILRDEKMNRMLRESAASRLSENLSWEAEEHILLDFYQKTINR
jgi:glycosyltransferase involved in cell wall biosynthesis